MYVSSNYSFMKKNVGYWYKGITEEEKLRLSENDDLFDGK